MLKSEGDDLIFVPPISKTGGDMSPYPPPPPRIDAPDERYPNQSFKDDIKGCSN